MVFQVLLGLNLRFLPLCMLVFSIGKQLFHVVYEGRFSVNTARFTLAYLGLTLDKHLTIDKFTMVFMGFGVIY